MFLAKACVYLFEASLKSPKASFIFANLLVDFWIDSCNFLNSFSLFLACTLLAINPAPATAPTPKANGPKAAAPPMRPLPPVAVATPLIPPEIPAACLPIALVPLKLVVLSPLPWLNALPKPLNPAPKPFPPRLPSKSDCDAL